MLILNILKTKQLKLLGVLTLGLVINGCQLSSQIASDLPESNLTQTNVVNLADTLTINYEKFTLENGLRVIVHPDHKTPVVNVSMWYHVGSKDEPKGKTGFAHLFEHLMTTGSEHYQSSYMSAYEGVGATGYNATTWFDRTNYYQTVPSAALERALWLESDRMTYMLSALTQDKLDQQRGIVRNEMTGRLNGMYGDWQTPQLEAIFPLGHPYRHQVYGSLADLNAATVADAKAWFKKYYGASNAVLVLSGDISIEQAKTLATKYFASAPSGPRLNKKTTMVPLNTAITTEVMQTKAKSPNLVRLWAAPAWRSKDSLLLSLVASTMFRGKDAFLNKQLVDTGIVKKVMVQLSPFELASQFKISMELHSVDDEEKASLALDRALQTYFEQGPDLSVLKRLVAQDLKRQITGLEGVAFVAKALAEGELYAGDSLHIKKQINWLSQASIEELKAAAKKWLSYGYYQVALRPTPVYKSINTQNVDRSKLPEVNGKMNFSLPDIQTDTLSNGIKVNFLQRNAVPLLQLSILFNAGGNADIHSSDKALSGGMALLSQMPLSAKSYSAEDIKLFLAQSASSLHVTNDDDFTSYLASMLKTNANDTLAILADILQSPKYSEEALKQAKKKQQLLFKRANRPQLPASIVLENTLFGVKSEAESDAIAINANAVTKSLTKINVKHIKQLHQTWIHPDNATIFVIGDATLEEIVTQLNTSIGQWHVKTKAGKKTKSTIKSEKKSASNQVIPPKIKQIKGRVILINKPNARQTGITAAHIGIDESSKHFTAFGLANKIFGAMGAGRLHQNLREDKSWTYVATSGHRKIRDSYVWTMGAFVQAGKTIPAMQEILKEVQLLTGNKPVTAKELKSVVGTEIGKVPAKFESSFMVLRTVIDAYKKNIPIDSEIQKAAQLQNITLDDVNSAVKNVVKPEQLIWVITGDLSKIEQGIRALNLGEVSIYEP